MDTTNNDVSLSDHLAEVLVVHAEAGIVVAGTDHIDPAARTPLIYSFRHYFGLGDQLGHSFRSETATT